MSRKILLTVVISVLLCVLLPGRMDAGVDCSVDFYSRYIWRGFDLNPDNKPVVQPSITYAFGDSGFSVNLWGSFSFENSELNETDITLSYEFKNLKTISLSIGFIHYGWYFTEGFTLEDNTTQEVYVTAGLPGVPLNPTVSLYYDINNGDGLYATFGVSHGLSFAQSLTLELAATLGYNGGQWTESTGFSNLNLTASLPISLNKISIAPIVGTTFILMDEVNPGVDNEFYVGVSLAF